jgi:hypothetical protein
MTCHANCKKYLEWKKGIEEEKKTERYLSTVAHQKKTENALRQMVKNRADGRGKNRGE